MKAPATIVVLLGLAMGAAASAPAAPTCGDAVVTDWRDGRIEGRYAPRCYGQALEALPEDVRAYTTAEEDITVALGARIRELRARQPAHDDAASSPGGGPVPIALLSGAGIALALGLAGLVRLLAPRLRGRLGQRSTRAVGQW